MSGPDRRVDPSADEFPCIEALYDTYGTLVYSLALRILRDVGDAEDVVQDVFVQAWNQRRRYDRGRGRVVAWLLVMTRSRAIDRVRARRGADRESGRAPGRVDDLPAPNAADLDDVRVVRDAIARLTVDQRRALELAYFDGYTHVEIAGILKQPLGTIKTRIRSAMLRLRDHFVARGPVGSACRIRTPRIDPTVLQSVLLSSPAYASARCGIRYHLSSRSPMTASNHLHRHRRSLSLSQEPVCDIHGLGHLTVDDVSAVRSWVAR